MALFLKKNKQYRALAFVDPQGMQVNWNAMEVFKGINVDMWLLVPTGIGVNRMLTKSGNISDNWLKKLSAFLGISQNEVRNAFYREKEDLTLFGSKSISAKVHKPIEEIVKLYIERLKTIWEYVSEPYPMKNKKGSLMFHLILASQNPFAQRIANDIIRKSK